jgi:hypothetical protein
MRISRQPSTVQIEIDEKHQALMEYFTYLASIVINDARCTFEIKSGIVMAKAAFNTKNALFTTSKLDLILRTELVKYYIWSITLYGAETRILWKVDQKYLEVCEVSCCRRPEARSWTDRVRN